MSFFLIGIGSYLECQATGSDVMLRYLKPLLEHRLAIAMTFTLSVCVFHYQFSIKSTTEVRCRLLVGDRLHLLRMRYGLECIAILAFIFSAFAIICFYLGFPLTQMVYVFLTLFLYLSVSASFLGGK